MWTKLKNELIERLLWAEVLWRVGAVLAFAWCIPAYRYDPLAVPLVGAVLYQVYMIFRNDVQEEVKFQKMVRKRDELDHS